jgi:hypothetical protein
MIKKLLVVAALSALPLQAMAIVYEVKALENSTTGGTGVAVAGFALGDTLTVTVNPLDLWNAGPLPRWSNADGLTGTLLATGAPDTNGDNPGVAAGVQIGQGFVDWSQGGLVAPYGSLVGQWGNSANFFLIGTNYTGVAAHSALNLYYFDSNNYDNTGSVLVNVTAVPEAETYSMMLLGLGLMGFVARRRKSNQA